MKIRVDLHIHSALSPCAEEEMTPGNLVGMARLKGLDVIAVTDHQSCANCQAAISLSRQIGGPVVLPGLEVTSAEEIHLLCLFADLKAAEDMAALVKAQLIAQKNRPEIFGRQLLFNDQDEISGEETNLLLMPTRIRAQEIAARCLELGGACLPAHIDREANSILATFGLLPDDFPASWLELSYSTEPDHFFQRWPALRKYPIIRNSDAHRLVDIAEPGFEITLPNQIPVSQYGREVILALRRCG